MHQNNDRPVTKRKIRHFIFLLIFSHVLLEKRSIAVHSLFHRKWIKQNNNNNKVIHFIFPFITFVLFFLPCFGRVILSYKNTILHRIELYTIWKRKQKKSYTISTYIINGPIWNRNKLRCHLCKDLFFKLSQKKIIQMLQACVNLITLMD